MYQPAKQPTDWLCHRIVFLICFLSTTPQVHRLGYAFKSHHSSSGYWRWYRKFRCGNYRLLCLCHRFGTGGNGIPFIWFNTPVYRLSLRVWEVSYRVRYTVLGQPPSPNLWYRSIHKRDSNDGKVFFGKSQHLPWIRRHRPKDGIVWERPICDGEPNFYRDRLLRRPFLPRRRWRHWEPEGRRATNSTQAANQIDWVWENGARLTLKENEAVETIPKFYLHDDGWIERSCDVRRLCCVRWGEERDYIWSKGGCYCRSIHNN